MKPINKPNDSLTHAIPVSDLERILAEYTSRVDGYISQLKQLYRDSNQSITPHLKKKIELFNQIYFGALPALPVYLIYQTNVIYDQGEINFLNFLLDHGLDHTVVRPYISVLYEKVCAKNELNLLKWLLERCHFMIENSPDSPHPIRYVATDFHSAIHTYILENITAYNEARDTPLILAIRHDCPLLFEWLVFNKQYDVHATNNKGMTPLMVAIEHDRAELFLYLLVVANHFEFIDKRKTGAFQAAIYYKRTEFLCTLIQEVELKNLSLLETTNWLGYNVLHWALLHPQIDSFDLTPLLDPLAHLVRDPLGRNLAVFACVNKYCAKAEEFINRYQLDIHEVSQDGMNALHHCIVEGALESAKWLINKKKFQLDAKTTQGDTPLILAAKHNQIAFVSYFLFDLKCGHLQDVNNQGKHVGHYLAEKNAHELLKKIFSKQHQVNLLLPDLQGNTMLDIALEHGRSHDQTVAICLKYTQFTSAIAASLKQFPALLDFFCVSKFHQKGSWVMNEQTPLHLACLHAEQPVIQTLVLTHGLNVNAPNKAGESPLYLMIKNKLTEKAIWFQETFTPKLSKLDASASSLLYVACEEEDICLVQWCLERSGLSLLKPGKNGLNALDIGLIKQNKVVVQLLWDKLIESQRNIYIANLIKENKSSQLAFLIEQGFYRPPREKISKPVSTVTPPMTTDSRVVVEQPKTLDCDRDLLLNAIDKGLLNYLKELKHHPEHDALIKTCAEELLIRSIKKNHPGVFNHLLRLPPIKEVVHLYSNIALLMARELGNNPVVESLLRISDVQKTVVINNNVESQIIPTAKTEYKLNPNASEWNEKPKCYTHNPRLKKLLDIIFENFRQSKCDGYLYGSSNYKIYPSDFDILLPNILSHEDKNNVHNLLLQFIQQGGQITAIHPVTGEYGYRKKNRHVIPMDWMDFKIEFLVSEKSHTEHGKILDFTIGAIYFDLKTQRTYPISGIYSAFDVSQRRIHTISDPIDNFSQDLSLIFRAARLIAAEGFYLSFECEHAIRAIFSGHDNPFILNMNPDKLNQQLTLLFNSGYAEQNIETLYGLGVLPKLIDCLYLRADPLAHYFADLLSPFYNKYLIESSPNIYMVVQPFQFFSTEPVQNTPDFSSNGIIKKP